MRGQLRAALAAMSLAGITGATPALAWPAETMQELAMRDGPGMNFGHVEVLPPGSFVHVNYCDDRGWCEVSHSGVVGFLRRRNLARVRHVEYMPPPPPPRPGVEIYVGPRPYPRDRYYYGYGRRW
jgi:uncharacterized protein YraI